MVCCNWLLRSLGSSFDNSSVKDGKEFEKTPILVRAASSCAGSPQARGTARDNVNVLSAARVWGDSENQSTMEVNVISFVMKSSLKMSFQNEVGLITCRKWGMCRIAVWL